MTAADLQALREAGWEDREIHDACQVVAYFNYINRIADGLGVDPEGWLPPLEPPAGDQAP
jgi:alkylhydroperoxidase family enzyme